MYAVSMSSLIDDEVARVLAGMNRICIDDAAGGLEMLAAEEPLAKKFLNHDPGNHAPWRDLMQQNSLKGLSGKAPVFIAQGTDDKLVRPSVTDQFVEMLCHDGKSVTYEVVAGADHETISRRVAASAVAWTATGLEANQLPAPADCRGPEPPLIK
jgi:acetyl esterase/lipase